MVNKNKLENDKNSKVEIANSKPHPIMAGIIDFYIYLTVSAGIVALINAVFNVNIFSLNIYAAIITMSLVFILVIVFCVLYYKKISIKIEWLSLGEKIMGRIIINEVKYWTNPYSINRWGLFIFIIIQIIIFGNNFDGISRGEIYPFVTLMGKYIYSFLIIYGLVKLGQGSLKSMFVFIIIHFFNIISSFVMESSFAFFFMAFILVLDIIIFIVYGLLTRNKKTLSS